MEKGKLPWKTRIGYGLCTCADSVPYNLFYIYFMFFLTDVVGVVPALAGTISFIALVWDAITDPIVGGMSDNYVTPKGRRLPWMKVSIVPLAVSVFLMFAPFNIQNTFAQNVYYILVSMAIWLFYTTYLVPYFSMGAEITDDYSERNILRFMTMWIAYPLLMLVSSGPMWIWAWEGNRGIGDRGAWGITGGVFAVFMLILCTAGMIMLKGVEKDVIKTALAAKAARIKENFFIIVAKCLKIKVFRRIVIWILIYMLGFSMLNTVFVYLMTYNAGMNDVQQAVFWTVYAIIVIVTLPVTTFFCNKYGKKQTMIITMGQAIISSIVFYFVGITSLATMYIFAVSSVIGSSSFFTFYVGYSYDCIEIDEFMNGTRREGTMSAIATFAQKFGSALAMWVTGFLLQFTGYSGSEAVQTEKALKGILSLGTLYPALLWIIAMLLFLTYPVTIQKFNALCDALANKKVGKEYSTAGFEDLLK